MLLHPLQNTPNKIIGGWGQTRPRITQNYGDNPAVYKQFGHDGHNGVDFGPNGNETIYAPFSGEAKVFDQGNGGYGRYIKIRDGEKEVTLAHLREVFILDGQKVYMGDKVGLMGNTGFSSAKHLHLTLKFTELVGKIWSRKILNENNGFGGAVDPLPFMITWKGTHEKDTL